MSSVGKLTVFYTSVVLYGKLNMVPEINLRFIILLPNHQIMSPSHAQPISRRFILTFGSVP